MAGRKTNPRQHRKPRLQQPRRPSSPITLDPAEVPPVGAIGMRGVGAPTSEIILPSSIVEGRAGRPDAKRQPLVQITDAYRQALDVDLPTADASPERLHKRLLTAMARGGRVKVSQIVAASMLARSTKVDGRDAVAAVREITDRVEGPVTQKSQVVSTRYVVSVSPTGALVEAALPPSTPEEWEARALADEERQRRAQLVAATGVSGE